VAAGCGRADVHVARVRQPGRPLAFAKDLSSPIDTAPQTRKRIRSGREHSRRLAAK
jgi:hypothetical protein